MTSVEFEVTDIFGTHPTGLTGTAISLTTDGLDIDAVHIKARGARCLYTFSGHTTEVVGLRNAGKLIKPWQVTVCADGKSNPPPGPLKLDDDVENGVECSGTLSYSYTENGITETRAVEIGEDDTVIVDGDDLTALCGAEKFSPCLDTCVNFEARSDSAACAVTNLERDLQDGQMDLEACRPCDYTDPQTAPLDKNGDPIYYCWEYTHSVVPYGDWIEYDPPTLRVVPGTGDPGDPRALGTMLKHGEVETVVESRYNKCTKRQLRRGKTTIEYTIDGVTYTDCI